MVRDAFRAIGIYAYSCDLEPDYNNSPYHWQGDAIEAAYSWHWDAMIAHPECTWIALSGMHWNYRGRQGKTPTECWQQTDKAADFFMKMANAPIEHIAIENPKCIMTTRWRKPDQKIQPYQFGEDASKETWLWLKNLPSLIIDPGWRCNGRIVDGKERWANQTDSGQNRLGPSDKRSAERSNTYPLVANQFALQWGRYLLLL